MVTNLPIYNLILVTLINIIGVSLIIIIFSNNRKGKINKSFLWMGIFMIFWVNFSFLARAVGEENLILSKKFLHIAWFVTPLFLISLYFLIIFLLKKEYIYLTLNKVITSIGITLAIMTIFTNWIIKDIYFVDDVLKIYYGKGISFFLFGIFFIAFTTLYIFLKEYLKSKSYDKKKLEYFFVGMMIFYIMNIIFNITLPIFFNIRALYFLGDYSTIFLLFFTGYAIIKKELFDVRILLAQSFIIIIGIILLFQTVFSESIINLIWNLIIFSFFSFFGYFLSKNVVKEMNQKKEFENLAKKLEENNEKLMKLDKVKTEFVSIASHQLRTPLTAIKGYISMISEETYGKISKEAKEKLENVALSNERLIKLVNDLLSVSRIETGKIELNLKKENIEEIISETVNELKINAERKGLYLKFKKPNKKIPEIMVDEIKLRQVILNLIDNSIKYTINGGITIDINNHKEGKDVIIKIVDTGEGMDQEELSKVFASFSRGQAGNQLSAEGAGLGLFVARKFIEMHGGIVWSKSKGKGKGSQFYIKLPIK